MLPAVMCEWQVSGFDGRCLCRSLYLFGWLNQRTVERTAGVRQDGAVLGGVNGSGGRRVDRHLWDQQDAGLDLSVQSNTFI